MKNSRLIILAAVAILILLAVFYLEGKKPGSLLSGNRNPVAIDTSSMTKQDKAKKYSVAQEITNPDGFVNTDGITIQELIGKKVILIDFWTYSCINCQRTLPYLTSWYEKYRDQGLEIIGIHTPEFEFEKEIENVQWAVDKYNIEYPVVLDNDYGTWSAYRNRYWPRKYIIDIDGFIVYDHIGEGAYGETEQVIQHLLAERKEVLAETGKVSTGIVNPAEVEKVNNTNPRSPEIYFGAWRNNYLGNGRDRVEGVQNFEEPKGVKANILYFDGRWDIQREFAKNLESKGKIIFRYQGEKVFMVARANQDVKLTILRDGEPIGEAGGTDVINGQVTVNEDRLYRLIEDPEGWGEHTLEIIVENPGLEAFTFTFG